MGGRKGGGNEERGPFQYQVGGECKGREGVMGQGGGVREWRGGN